MSSDLNGWSNEATRDIWSWLVSSRENLPVFTELLLDSPFIDDFQREFHKIIMNKNILNTDKTRLLSLLEFVDWDQIGSELRDLGLRYSDG